MDKKVVVVGSANADLVVEVSRRPAGGETVAGSDLSLFPGGKGANQAAAAARAGATTVFLGCIGDDANGDLLRRHLATAGVDITGLRSINRPTGTALILLTPDGENSIVVSPGANSMVSVEMVEELEPVWMNAGIVVLDLEIPHQTVTYVVHEAASRGLRVLLNPAPATRLDKLVLAACDPLVLNEHEARIVLAAGEQFTCDEIANELLSAGARSVVITLGASGAIIADAHGTESVAAHRVNAIDTTGAGDAFVGAVACELANGAELRDAVKFATAMSAIAVQSKGAQPSYPDRTTIDAFLKANDTCRPRS